MGQEEERLGKFGESLAIDYLKKNGYRIISTNYATFLGEIDIIAQDGDYTVFVEVKTRRSTRFGPPFLSITDKKRKKILHNALCYLKEKRSIERKWRIDIVSILIHYNRQLKTLELFRNALSEDALNLFY